MKLSDLDWLDNIYKSINLENLPHGIIINGPNGIGKEIFAKELASQLLLNKNTLLQDCDLLNANNHPDYFILQKDKINLLLKEVNKLKNFSITSFKEKNIINLYNLRKKLNLGLLIPSTFNFDMIVSKSKKKYIKFLVLEKKFLREKRLNKIKKKIYFYTIKKSSDFKKYKNFNLIFENL